MGKEGSKQPIRKTYLERDDGVRGCPERGVRDVEQLCSAHGTADLRRTETDMVQTRSSLRVEHVGLD